MRIMRVIEVMKLASVYRALLNPKLLQECACR